jgi:hypothetical protein
MLDNNKYLVVSPKWVLYSKTDWPTDRRSQYNFNFDFDFDFDFESLDCPADRRS